MNFQHFNTAVVLLLDWPTHLLGKLQSVISPKLPGKNGKVLVSFLTDCSKTYFVFFEIVFCICALCLAGWI
jgi:hypothetical protein